MTPISTCLIEQNIFFREGVKSLLNDTAYDIIKIYPDCPSLQKETDAQNDIKLHIIGIECEPDIIKTQISIIKEITPHSKIALFTSRATPECVVSAFSAGADGYLLRDIAPEALASSLDMIMAGERLCPMAVLDIFMDETKSTETYDINSKAYSYKLSLRELQVLKSLAVGETNKEIARNLEISEATVKVHIKAVLRKLDLSNRTQAAVWAVNKGLTKTNSPLLEANAA